MSILLPSKPRQLSNNINPTNPTNPTIPNTTTNIQVDNSGLYILDDNSPSTNLVLKTNDKLGLYISDTQRIGININASPTKRLIINDELGESIRLIYNNNSNIVNDINIDSNGSLLLKTYNNQYVDFINDTNSLQTNIKINGEILIANAMQLNYTVIETPGIAIPNKALILDNFKSISGINQLHLETLNVNFLNLNNTLRLFTNILDYNLHIKNDNGKCLKLENNENISIFDITSDGILNIYNKSSNNIIEFLSDKNNNLIYPIQLTTENNLNNTGIGIKFNTYNSDNKKRNMSSIETIITNNENNNENSIMKFNNMNNGHLINTVTIRNDGFILCNTLMELSDRRTKNIINNSDFTDSLDKLCKINTYNFIYKNDIKKKIHKGLIAQELYEIIPSAVNIENNGDISDLHTVSNKELIGYIIDSIKALKYKIDNIYSL
jgi:hypothetical protein